MNEIDSPVARELHLLHVAPGGRAVDLGGRSPAECGLEFTLVRSLEAALRLMGGEHFDGVLVDGFAFTDNGQAGCSALLEMKPTVPVFVTLEFASAAVVDPLFELGVEDVLTRSRLSRIDFASLVDAALKRRQHRHVDGGAVQGVETVLAVFPAPAMIVGVAGEVRFVNVAMERLLRRPRAAIEQLSFPVEPIFGAKQEIDLILPGGQHCVAEMFVEEIEWKASRAYLVTLHDVTERKRAAVELARSEEHYRLLADNAEDLISLFDRDGTVLYDSPSVERFWGGKRDTLRRFGNMIDPRDLPAAQQAFDQILERGGSIAVEYRMLRRVRYASADAPIWFEAVFKAVPGLDGATKAVLVVRRDFTRRKSVETRLAESEELFRLISESSRDLIGLYDRDGAVVYLSPSVRRLRGEGKDQEISRFGEFTVPEDRKLVHQAFTETLQGKGAKTALHRVISSSAEVVNLESQFMAVRLPAGRGDGVLVIGRDVSARSERDEALRQAERLQSLGDLTGGVAHEFNNLMGIVLGHLDLINEKSHAEVALSRHVSEATRAAERAVSITQALRTIAQRAPLSIERCEINELLASAEPIIASTLGASVAIEWERGKESMVALVDPAGLRTGILNLVLNARDALDDGGEREKRLSIETRRQYLSSSDQPGRNPGWYLVVRIVDNGCGMTDDECRRAMEPFYTTKPSGQGSGLGLSWVNGYLRQLNGFLTLESAKGAGTTASIYLPQALDDSAAVRKQTGGIDG